MPSIYDYANAEEIAAYYTEKGSNEVPYLGRTLFPRKKQLGLELSWIKGAGGLPVALQPSEFDTKATLRDRIGFSDVKTEMPFFREAMRIGEKDRQQLNNLMAASNSDMIEPLLENVFDDVTGLVEGAEVQAERMRMQLLSGFEIDIQANRKVYTYNYDPEGELTDHVETLSGDDMWSDLDNSNPVEDIREAQETVEEETGVKPTRSICTRKTFNYMLQNRNIVNDMEAKGYIQNNQATLTDSLLEQYLLEQLELEVAIYNKKFALEVKDQSAKKFFPDDVFTLIPGDGTLGNTYYGTTPEESDLMTGNSNADVEIVDTGIAVTTIKDPHPVNVQTVVSGIFLPSYPRMAETYIIEVHSE